ncbi:MAG: RsmB/NOP family class I SAM-dependent RNA methyltransferase [Brotaphodocola sp.]
MSDCSNPWNLPERFLEKMKKLLGEEYEAFLKSYNEERVQGLRFNTRKGDQSVFFIENQERFGLSAVPWCAEGFYYRQDTRPGRHPYHEAGVYYIQEPSAMAVVSLLDPKPGELVLDLCAAPGGKTTHIAERLCGKGLLVSNEIHPARAKILSQNVERMGIENAVVTNEDSGRLKKYFPEFFDRIVVDAPCSGEGMFRKDEQARSEWSEENVRICADRQQEILDNAADMLRPGGRLVYSTCTFSPEEDEDGISCFLDRHPEFTIVKVPDVKKLSGLSAGRPEWSREKRSDLADTYRIWPHKAEGEGHYLALLEKSRTEEEGNRKKKSHVPKYWNDRAGMKLLQEFFKDSCNDFEPPLDSLVLFGEQIYWIPKEMPDFSGLKVLRPGLHLGTLKKNRLEPSHALALFLHPCQVRSNISLGADEALLLDYLKGYTLSDEKGRKGWTLVCADGYSIGWAKAASGILKNHYPKGLRI